MATGPRAMEHSMDDSDDEIDWDASSTSSSSSQSSISPTTSPVTSALRSLSLSSSPPDTPTKVKGKRATSGHRRMSYSTAATSAMTRSDSEMSLWTEDSDSSDAGGEGDSEEDGRRAAASATGRLMAVSAPVRPLQLLLPNSGNGVRKRSLTEVLPLGNEEEKGRVVLELSSWINDKPSPFETETPTATPLPRPFPLSQTSTSPFASDPTNDARGVPHQKTPSIASSNPQKRSYGFIPWTQPLSPASIASPSQQQAQHEAS
ncbi:hypothetical protein T439DRAFT_321985 [Meredithblackwellia eburnea MCA 4105]